MNNFNKHNFLKKKNALTKHSHTGKVGFLFTNSKNPSPIFPRALSLKILQYLQAIVSQKLLGPKQKQSNPVSEFLPLITQDSSPSGWEEAWCAAQNINILLPSHQSFTSSQQTAPSKGVSPGLHPAPGPSIFYGWEMKLLHRSVISAQVAYREALPSSGSSGGYLPGIPSSRSRSPHEPWNQSITGREHGGTAERLLHTGRRGGL